MSGTNAPHGMAPSVGMKLDRLAPGVQGYILEHEGCFYVPVVLSDRPGKGNVGKWLDSLDPAKTWKFPTVISGILEGMLRKRGFTRTLEWAPEFMEMAEIWVREAKR